MSPPTICAARCAPVAGSQLLISDDPSPGVPPGQQNQPDFNANQPGVASVVSR